MNGKAPDLVVHNEQFYPRVLSKGSLGLGESFMDGWWDSLHLDTFITKLFNAGLEKKIKTFHGAMEFTKALVFNRQTQKRSYKVGEVHYDAGNDLYQHMLDSRMVYTCGYWKDAHSLDEAQTAKLDLVCKKIGLKKGDKVLDIGCGWGSFAKFAAENYGARVIGVTISKEQAALARENCKGLDVEIRLQDYRDVHEPFDHIISLGMFEHVGYKNYRAYMKVAHRCLKEDGLFLLHTIGGNRSAKHTDAWIEKYIFPNSMIPSGKQIMEASEGLFVMEDWHNFGPDYDKTLMAWWNNFDTAWDKLKTTYDERFYRMWKFYLLSCAASFRTRKNHLWQIVFSKGGVEGGYVSVR